MAQRQISTSPHNFFCCLCCCKPCRRTERDYTVLQPAGHLVSNSIQHTDAFERNIEDLRSDYVNTVHDIWIIKKLEEDCGDCIDLNLVKFNQLRAVLDGLPDEHYRKWGTFLNRYPILKRELETFENEQPNSHQLQVEGLTKLKECLKHVKTAAKKDAKKQRQYMNQQGPRLARDFPGLKTSSIDLKGKKVTSSGSRRGHNYEENVGNYLREDFPDLQTKGYCCPEPVITLKRNSNLQWKCSKKLHKSGKSQAKDGGTATVEKRNAPSKIAKRFKVLLEETMPCAGCFFMFTSLQFKNVLKYVKDVKISRQKGDFDILVISQKFGIFVGEFKCSESTSTNWGRNMSEAMYQIFKDKTFLAELFRDRPDILEIPVHDFIALPLIQDPSEIGEGCISNFDLKKLLFKDSLHNDGRFYEWFNKLRVHDLEPSMTADQYLTIAERLAGFGSYVDRNSKQRKIRVEGNQHFHHPLTSSQKEKVEKRGDRFLAIGGDYGTGKSLMLVRRAEYQSANYVGGRVVMVSCADISVSGECVDRSMPEHSVHHLERLLERRYKEVISVQNFGSFIEIADPLLYDEDSCLSLLKNAVEKLIPTDNETSLHLFFDEVPVNFLSKQYFQDFLNWLCDATPSNLTTWITIATHSYRVCDNVHLWVHDYLPTKFQYFYLDEVLRAPKRVYELKREICSYCNDTFNSRLVEDAEEGSMPLLYRVPSCKCSRQMKESQSHFTSDCCKKRLKCTLKMIFNELKETTPEQDNEALDLSKIVLIVSNVECTELENKVCNLLEESCRQLNVEVKNEVSGSDEAHAVSQCQSILLTKDTYFISCERHVVICVDLSAMKHWFENGKVGYTSLVVSRCLSAYIHLSLQEEEASIMFGWDMEAAKQGRDEELCRKIDEALKQNESPGHGCLQTLLDKGVIVERSVDSPNVLPKETSV